MNHLIETKESYGGNMTTVTIHAEDAFAAALRNLMRRVSAGLKGRCLFDILEITTGRFVAFRRGTKEK
jgi:hypothetical protein